MRIQDTRRPVGRPPGAAAANTAKVLEYLKRQEQPVPSTTAELTQRVGLSKRQIERSILSLKRSAQVRITHRKKPFSAGRWANQRFIYVIGE
jgi:DNA-binding IclR family transcriptional regulator